MRFAFTRLNELYGQSSLKYSIFLLCHFFYYFRAINLTVSFMRTVLFTGILLVLTVSAIGQYKIDATLKEHVANSTPGELLKIRIEFQDKFDVSGEKNRLNAAQTPVSERAKIIINALVLMANNTQNRVLSFLKANGYKVRCIQQFWITNVLFCEASSDVIELLADFPEIKMVYFENNRFELGDVVLQEEHVDVRGPGGTEPSIEACNVRPLWDLGYTGRGRKVFVYDTGVWPTHPAIAERFMGNRTFMEESWYGYYHFEPNGERNSHGTHVLGTMVGLEESTSDSIGIAMNAYWIANDHVGTSIAVMPDLPYLMAAYQWALNPDGDLTTSDDIPDVINNSFRWYDGADQEQCEGIVVDLMIAIEAAGVANIYSGGNHGPSNTTISAPQRINVTEVNTFSVGSINGNLPFPYPLSSFSSLGPKQCPGSGSLSIHPEVVAPGQNVRSAWAHDAYNTISGTSMASPHVSGVTLLLKEAFPFLSGEDILWAIYLTAIDMGEPGEDNVYGMGMIDAYAAFNFLAENHSPVNPNQVDYDLAVETIEGVVMNGVYCNNHFNLSVKIENKGLQTIEAFEITYGLIGSTMQTQNWSGALVPGQVISVDVGDITTDYDGLQEFQVVAQLVGVEETYDLINNRRHLRWNVRPVLAIPFIDEFEQGWNSGLWTVYNPDFLNTWRTVVAPSNHVDNKAAAIQLTNYNPAGNQRDELQSPLFLIPASGEVLCDWNLSYRKRSGISSHLDTLYVLVQHGCNGTRDTLAVLAGDNLAVITSPFPNFIPQNESDWRNFEYDLSDYHESEIQIVFQTVNRAGNNLYIDNFRIYESQNPPLSLGTLLAPEIQVYPNPSKENFVFEIKNVQLYASYQLTIFNILGHKIEDIIMDSNRFLLEFNHQPPGVYLAVVQAGDNRSVHRIVKY